jgi:hypothetical protein
MLSEEEIVSAFASEADDIAFVSGSREEGFGNAHSDYDVFLLRAAETETMLLISFLPETYIDCEIHWVRAAKDTATKLKSISPDDFRAVWDLPLDELDFYYRLLIGRPVLRRDAFRAIQAEFDKPTIERVVCVWSGLHARTALQKSNTLALVGQSRAAYFAAQDAAAHAIDSFLARQGESYTSFKWRFEKLQRLLGPGSDLYRRAWSLKALGPRSIDAYRSDVAALCADCGVRQFDAWSLNDVVYKVSPTARVVNFDGKRYVIQNKIRVYELSPQGAIVWQAIDGTSQRREVARRAFVDGSMSELEFDATLAELAGAALVSE